MKGLITTLPGMSVCLLYVHIIHTTLVAGWVDLMALYELEVFDPFDLILDPMWRKGMLNPITLVVFLHIIMMKKFWSSRGDEEFIA